MHICSIKSAVLLHTTDNSSLSCGENHKHLILANSNDIAQSRKFYYDSCLPASAGTSELYTQSNVNRYVQEVVQGHNSALFVVNAGQAKTFGTLSVALFDRALSKLHDLLQPLSSINLYFAFIGLSDARSVDLLQERGIPSQHLLSGIENFYEPVDSVDSIKKKLSQGSSLPYILAIRIEQTDGNQLVGNLFLADLGVARFDVSEQSQTSGPTLNRSVGALGRVISSLSQTSFIGPVPYNDNVLTSLASEYIGGNSKTLFVFNIESPTEIPSSETILALTFAESVRKVKNRATRNKIDLRVFQLEDKLSNLTTSHEIFTQDHSKLSESFNHLAEQLRRETEDALARDMQAKNESIEMQERVKMLKTSLEEEMNAAKSRDSEINELNHNIVMLKEKLETIQSNFSEFRERVARDEIVASHNALMSTSQIAELKEELRNTKIELSTTMDERDRFKLEKKSLESEIEHLMDCHEVLGKTHDLHVKSYKELLSSFHTLEKEYVRVDTDLATSIESNKTLVAKNDELISRIESAKIEFKTLYSEFSNLMTSHQNLKLQYNELLDCFEMTKGENELLLADLRDLKHEKANMETNLANLANEKEEMEESLEFAEKSLKKTDMEIGERDVTNRKLEGEKKKLEEDVRKLTDVMTQLSESIRDVHSDSKKMRQGWDEEKVAMEQEIEELKKRLKESRINTKTISAENEELHLDINNLKKKLRNADTLRNATAEEKRAAYEKEMADLEKRYKATEKAKAAEWKQEKDEYQNEIDSLNKKLKTLDKLMKTGLDEEKKSHDNQVKELKKQAIETSRAKEEAWNEEKEKLDKEVERLKKQLMSDKTNEDIWAEEGEAMRKEIANLKNQLKEATQRNDDNLQGERELFEIRIAELQAQLQMEKRLQQKSQFIEAELQKDKEVLVKYIEKLKRELQRATDKSTSETEHVLDKAVMGVQEMVESIASAPEPKIRKVRKNKEGGVPPANQMQQSEMVEKVASKFEQKKRGGQRKKLKTDIPEEVATGAISDMEDAKSSLSKMDSKKIDIRNKNGIANVKAPLQTEDGEEEDDDDDDDDDDEGVVGDNDDTDYNESKIRKEKNKRDQKSNVTERSMIEATKLKKGRGKFLKKEANRVDECSDSATRHQITKADKIEREMAIVSGPEDEYPETTMKPSPQLKPKLKQETRKKVQSRKEQPVVIEEFENKDPAFDKNPHINKDEPTPNLKKRKKSEKMKEKEKTNPFSTVSKSVDSLFASSDGDNLSTVSMSTELSGLSTSSTGSSLLGQLKKKRKLNFGKPKKLLSAIDDMTNMKGDSDPTDAGTQKINAALEQIKSGFTIPSLKS